MHEENLAELGPTIQAAEERKAKTEEELHEENLAEPGPTIQAAEGRKAKTEEERHEGSVAELGPTVQTAMERKAKTEEEMHEENLAELGLTIRAAEERKAKTEEEMREENLAELGPTIQAADAKAALDTFDKPYQGLQSENGRVARSCAGSNCPITEEEMHEENLAGLGPTIQAAEVRKDPEDASETSDRDDASCLELPCKDEFPDDASCLESPCKEKDPDTDGDGVRDRDDAFPRRPFGGLRPGRRRRR